MTWCPLKAKPVTRAFREVQRCPNEPLKAARRAAPQSERGTKMTCLRAKFLAQNCYAPTNKRQQKNAVVFCRLALAPLARSDLGLVLCRNKYKRDRKALPQRCRWQHFTLARCASISRGGQTTAVFHVCAKCRHFTAGAACPACAVYFELSSKWVGKGQFKNAHASVGDCSSPAASVR